MQQYQKYNFFNLLYKVHAETCQCLVVCAAQQINTWVKQSTQRDIPSVTKYP